MAAWKAGPTDLVMSVLRDPAENTSTFPLGLAGAAVVDVEPEVELDVEVVVVVVAVELPKPPPKGPRLRPRPGMPPYGGNAPTNMGNAKLGHAGHGSHCLAAAVVTG